MRVVLNLDQASKLDINLSGFSLPMFGLTSPFFNNTSTVPNQRSVSHSTDGSIDSTEGTELETEQEGDQDHTQTRPLTPPIVSYAQPNENNESPHRIPSFEFMELSLHAVEKVEIRTARLNFTSPIKSASQEIKVSNSSSSTALAGSGSMEFGKTTEDTSGLGSTTTKVRQRISREMIRETIQARIADGSISKRNSAMPLTNNRTSSPVTTPQRPVSLDRPTPAYNTSKDLPPPPEVEMVKAHTTDGTSSREKARPVLRPRSQTQSAHEVLKANERDGILDEPRSALDRLMDIAPQTQTAVSSPGEGLIAPVVLARPVSPGGGDGMAGRERAIIERRKELGRQGSGGGVGRRRSLSTGDAEECVVSPVSLGS
jgi:serine/arginine repetitive matrix protein 2